MISNRKPFLCPASLPWRLLRPRVPFALLAIAVIVAFHPAFQAGYVYDDHRIVLHNPAMTKPLDLKALFFDKRGTLPDQDPDVYRPLSTLVLRLEHSLGGGAPVAHHIGGLCWHLLNTWLLLVLLLAGGGGNLAPPIARNESNGRSSSGAIGAGVDTATISALLGAGLFALHPVQVETVVWISSRAGQVATFFILLTLVATFRWSAAAGGDRGDGRERSSLRAACLTTAALPALASIAALAFVACLAKELGVVTGVLLAIFAWRFEGAGRRRLWLAVLAALVAAGIYMGLRQYVMEGRLDQVAPHGGDRWTSFLYGGYGCLYQTGLLLRCAFHNLDYQDGFFDATPFSLIVAGALVYFVLVAGALVLLRRAPICAGGVLFFAAAQFPSSSLIVPMRSLVNDRYLYLPLAGAAFVLSGFLLLLARSGRRRVVLAATQGAVVLGLLLLLLLTIDRGRDWIDGQRLWQRALETHPASIKGHVGLARAQLEAGCAEDALATAVKGYHLAQPGSAVRMNALYKACQALIALERLRQAEDLLRQLVFEARSPERSEDFRLLNAARVNLCRLMILHGNSENALEVAGDLLHDDPTSPLHHDLMGNALLGAWRLADAEQAFLHGSRLPGAFPLIHDHLAELYERTGRLEPAARERREAERERQALRAETNDAGKDPTPDE